MTVVELFTVQLIQDEAPVMQWIHKDKVEAIMAEAEQNITDLLPAGWRARIRRWNQPDNEGNNDE